MQHCSCVAWLASFVSAFVSGSVSAQSSVSLPAMLVFVDITFRSNNGIVHLLLSEPAGFFYVDVEDLALLSFHLLLQF